MRRALVCGAGDLPGLLAAALPEPPLICALEGHEPAGLEVSHRFRIETLGTLLARLAAERVTEVCFCGAIDRPVLSPGSVDLKTLPLVPRMLGALRLGDDGALRVVMEIFESRGFRVRAVQDLVADILVPCGVLGACQPGDQMRSDAEKAAGILKALAPFDVGQACVVGHGQLLGVETIAGTDALVAGLPDVPQRSGAVLVKGPKAGQDMRVDVPTIGPRTVAAAAAAGLGGVVIAANAVLVVHRDETVRRADAAGLVLWSRGDD